MQTRAGESPEAAAKILELEQHVQQLQYEANTAGALEYRCEGLQQDKQQLTQQLQQLKGNIAQMQASLHQERLQRQDQAALSAKILDTDKQQMQHRCTELEAKLRVAETRADDAEEEQYRTEQQLASGRSELARLQSQKEAAVHQSDDSGHVQLRAGDLARADSARLSTKAALETAKQRIQQLEQSGSGTAQHNATSGQMYPDGLSRLSTTMGQAGMPSGVASDSGASSHEATAQKLKRQVTGLKASRDKLLAEVDRQSTEIERLLTHNATLEQSLSHMQQSARNWEAQAQDSLVQLDQLKDLLEESAFWQSHSAASTMLDADPTGNRAQSTPTETELQKQVLQEKARATSLEVQVRALCLEVTRSKESAGTLSQSIKPALRGIEGRLAQLLQVAMQRGR